MVVDRDEPDAVVDTEFAEEVGVDTADDSP
jgi:hypothetical protein